MAVAAVASIDQLSLLVGVYQAIAVVGCLAHWKPTNNIGLPNKWGRYLLKKQLCKIHVFIISCPIEFENQYSIIWNYIISLCSGFTTPFFCGSNNCSIPFFPSCCAFCPAACHWVVRCSRLGWDCNLAWPRYATRSRVHNFCVEPMSRCVEPNCGESVWLLQTTNKKHEKT